MTHKVLYNDTDPCGWRPDGDDAFVMEMRTDLARSRAAVTAGDAGITLTVEVKPRWAPHLTYSRRIEGMYGPISVRYLNSLAQATVRRIQEEHHLQRPTATRVGDSSYDVVGVPEVSSFRTVEHDDGTVTIVIPDTRQALTRGGGMLTRLNTAGLSKPADLFLALGIDVVGW